MPRTTRKSRRNRGSRSRVLGRAEEGVDVELHAADDEEDRHQEAEPDGLELDPDHLTVGTVASRRTTTPAANAPRSTSRPSEEASQISRMMSSTEIRTGSCELECRFLRRRATSRGRLRTEGQQGAATATPRRPPADAGAEGVVAAEQHGDGDDRAELADRADGQHEPPNGVVRMSASRSMGSRVPSAVVVRTSPITSVLRANPVDTSTAARPKAMLSDTNQPTQACTRGWPLMRCRSISKPARNIRKASPSSDSPLTRSSTWAHPSTCCPMRMPSPISMTTDGMRSRRRRSASTGASTAATAISARDWMVDWSTNGQPRRRRLRQARSSCGSTPVHRALRA